MVIVEHAAEPLSPTDFPTRRSDLCSRLDNATSKPLMISLVMVIFKILGDHVAQAVFTEESSSDWQLRF